MSAVWVVRNRHGDIVHISSQEPYEQPASYTVTRETILTPAHAAVIDAAKAMDDVIRHPKICNYHEYISARNGLLAAVASLRELEAEV